MSNVCSLTGAVAGTERDWSWCSPGACSPKNTPFAIMCMIPGDSPRFVPTTIIAPESLRHPSLPYTEIAPTDADRRFVRAVYAWCFLFNPELDIHDQVDRWRARLCAHAVCTARRFLTPNDAQFAPAKKPIKDQDLHIGRSLLVRKKGSTRTLEGWLGSRRAPFDVLIFARTKRPERCLVPADCLGEDGSALRLRR